MKKSWKTSSAGVGLIAAQIAAFLWPQHADLFKYVGAAIAGGGLLAARDNNVTSEDAGLKPTTATVSVVGVTPVK